MGLLPVFVFENGTDMTIPHISYETSNIPHIQLEIEMNSVAFGCRPGRENFLSLSIYIIPNSYITFISTWPSPDGLMSEKPFRRFRCIEANFLNLRPKPTSWASSILRGISHKSNSRYLVANENCRWSTRLVVGLK